MPDGFVSHCQVPYVVLLNLFAGNSANVQTLYSWMCLGQKPVQLIVAYTTSSIHRFSMEVACSVQIGREACPWYTEASKGVSHLLSDSLTMADRKSC